MKKITKLFVKAALVAVFGVAGAIAAWGTDVVVTLENIGAGLGSTANTTAATTDITATGTTDTYTLNYYQCKKQGSAMLMTKSVSPYISNHTAMPGNIKSVEVFINTGAAAKTTYDCAFSTTECTSAVSGIGAVNITGGNSNTYSNMSGGEIAVKGKYFCITLGNANNGQVLKLVITCEASGTPSSCSAPTFSPAAGAVLSGTTVTLSSSTDGASIYYTMGAAPADPTASSTLYSTPISITEATTIKAIAVKDGLSNSSVASASYTILEPLTTMDAIYAKATSVGNTATSVAVTFDDWVVTGVKNNNAYVTDGTKGFIIYQSGHGFSVGDVLSGTASCKVQLYNGSSEITTLTSSTDGLSVSTGGVVTPVTGVSISSLSGVNTGAVYSFDNLAYDGTELSDGANTIKPYTTLYSGTFESGKSYNVTGVYLQFNSTKELLPRSAADIEEVVPADPTIIVSTSSLSGFTYEEGNGPSDAQSFTVSGSNLTENISLSMSGSDYEMSLSSGSGYTTSLSLTQTAGEVASTTVYVRLKADKSVASYEGSTITLTSDGADNKTVSLSGTVTAYVAPYATLPFSFDNGRDDVAGTAGLTHDGLGTDYGSSPKLKFDSTGDYLILQLNERPGVLTFDIKGNSFSGGTFKVQTSADGSSYSDLKSYTSLSSTESESFSDLASDVRYIKWIYTSKSNGNVALGNIALAAYTPPVPTITVSPTSLPVAAESVPDGSFAITYENMTINDASDFDIEFYDDKGVALSGGDVPDWLLIVVEESSGDYIASYTIDDNTSYDSRSAYFKVFAMGPEDFVYSSLVTITQSGLPTPELGYAALPFAFNGGKSDIASTDGISHNGLGSDYATPAPPLKFDGTGDYVILHFNEAPGTLTFDIKGNGFSGGTFTVLTSANGEDYTELASYTDLGDTQSEEFSSLASSVRYIKWIYTEKSSGNVGLGNINLTKPAAASTISLTGTLGADGHYYATFYSSSRYTLSEGATAYTMNSSNQLYRLGTDGSVVEDEAVIIISDSADITLTKSGESGAIAVHGGENILLGSDSPVASYTLPSGKKAIVLGVYSTNLGFYEFTGDGIPANKAYYLVNE